MSRFAACLAAVAIAGCAPTIRVAAPDEPIVINLNVRIEQEVRVRLEGEAKALLAEERAGVGTRSGAMAVDANAVREAKSRRAIGERWDGYLGALSPEAELVALRDRANAARRAEYERIATAQQTDLEAVRIVFGQARIAAAGPGEMIFERTGRWRENASGAERPLE